MVKKFYTYDKTVDPEAIPRNSTTDVTEYTDYLYRVSQDESGDRL